MENATKALLIAAAVLITIIVISIGVAIVTRGTETVNNSSDLSEYEVHQHNAKFTQYEGTNVSGTNVNALINAVFNYNLTQEDDTSMIALDYEGTALENDISIDPESFDNTATPVKAPTGARFSVECVLTNGVVTSVTVNDV